MDPIKKERNLIELDKEITQLKKEQFIQQIKKGLGEKIKNNGNQFHKMKVSRWKQFIRRLKSIF